MRRPPGKDMKERVRTLRREKTDAEKMLWRHLRARQLEGFKFRQQMWLCGYIADFACVEAKLVIEADGSQHQDAQDYDDQRSAAFAAEGYRTLRFWNNDILTNPDGVLMAIREALPSPSHPASPGGSLPLPERERAEGTRSNPSPFRGEGGAQAARLGRVRE